MKTLILFLCFLMTAACGGEEAPLVAPQPQLFDTEVTIIVRDAADTGIAGFPISFDKTIVGKTDRNGIFKVTLNEANRTPFEVEVLDLEGYEILSKVRNFQETVEVRAGKDGKGVAAPILQHHEQEKGGLCPAVRKKDHLLRLWAHGP